MTKSKVHQLDKNMKESKYRSSENKGEEIPKPNDLNNEISKKYLQIWRKVSSRERASAF